MGYDPVAQAMGGLTAVTGFPGQPVKCGASIADLSTGLFTAFGILAAFLYRMKTGEGQRLDMSLQDCVWQFSSVEWSGYQFLFGKVPDRTGNGHPIMVPSNAYPTKDGHLVFVTCGSLAQVQRLFSLIGGEDLANSPMCVNQAERVKYREQIDSIVAEWTKARNCDDVVKQIKSVDVPATKIPIFEEVCSDPQLISRDMILEVEQTISGPVKVPGSVFKLSKTPGDGRSPAPFLGEHNVEVYSEMLGYTEQEINSLIEEGLV
jgi:crotonobetainyl-CoA:carnitine CoA-transferase CaiB-like acyl-CoA transferase